MNSIRKLPAITLVAMPLIAGGCATVTEPPADFADYIHRVCIVVPSDTGEPKLRDHAGARGAQSLSSQAGALGALIEIAISRSNVKKSLGGSLDALKAALPGFSVSGVLREDVALRLSKRYTVLDARQFATDQAFHDLNDNFSPKKHLPALGGNGVDAVINLHPIFGLSGYGAEPPTAAIDVHVEIWDVSKNEKIRQRWIHSDRFHKVGRTIREFAGENGKLYKEDIKLASESIALQIGLLFGIGTEEANSRKEFGAIDYDVFTCKTPVKLTQDCVPGDRARRPVLMGSNTFNMSGSADGRSILIVEKPADAFRTLGEVSALLEAHDIHAHKQLTITALEGVRGYLLEVDGDGYAVLNALPRPPEYNPPAEGDLDQYR